MKIKIDLTKSCGVYVTVTYLKSDGELIFNDDKKSGIISNQFGDKQFIVVD